MADISNINLPNGENYDIKDKVARNDIAVNCTTLGKQCKNLIDTQIDSQTYYGLTFKRNSDGSILINGTSTNKSTAFLRIFKTYDVGKFINQKFILSATRSDNVGIQFDGRNSSGLQTCSSQAYSVDAKFTSNADFILLNIYLIIRANSTFDNYTVYPMLRYADITDSTYEPYQPSLKEQVPYSISLPSKSTSESYSYNGVPTMICLTPSESVSSGGGLYLINSVGTAVYLIDKTGIVINTDTTNKTFTITNNTASTYDVYISCAYKKE